VRRSPRWTSDLSRSLPNIWIDADVRGTPRATEWYAFVYRPSPARRYTHGPINEESIEDPVLLISFRRWMQQQRGTCDATLYNYGLDLRELLKSLGEDPTKFDAKSLRKFVLERSQQCGWGVAKQCTSAVRMFLRFLIADGKCAVGWMHLSRFRPLASFVLAAVFAADEVERVITSCDPATRIGRRDRAILLLLARLGLRAGDIVRLRLGDLDWKEAVIHVSGRDAARHCCH